MRFKSPPASFEKRPVRQSRWRAGDKGRGTGPQPPGTVGIPPAQQVGVPTGDGGDASSPRGHRASDRVRGAIQFYKLDLVRGFCEGRLDSGTVESCQLQKLNSLNPLTVISLTIVSNLVRQQKKEAGKLRLTGDQGGMQPTGGTVSCGDGGARHAFQMQRSALHFGALYCAIVPARRSKRWGTEGQATGDTVYLSFAPPLKCGCCFSLAENMLGEILFLCSFAENCQKNLLEEFEGNCS